MARLRQSGPIDFDDIQEFFGQTRGSAWDLDDYYRGGGIVPATGLNGGTAAVHQIAINPSASSNSDSGTAESFFLYLTGNSETEVIRTQTTQTATSSQGSHVNAFVNTSLSTSTFSTTETTLRQTVGAFSVARTDPNDIDPDAGAVIVASIDYATDLSSDAQAVASWRSIIAGDIMRFSADATNFFEMAITASEEIAVGTLGVTVRFNLELDPATLVINGTRADYASPLGISIRAFAIENNNSNIEVDIIKPSSERDIHIIDLTTGLNTDVALRDDLFNTITNQLEDTIALDTRTFLPAERFRWRSSFTTTFANISVGTENRTFITFDAIIRNEDYELLERSSIIRVIAGGQIFDLSHNRTVTRNDTGTQRAGGTRYTFFGNTEEERQAITNGLTDDTDVAIQFINRIVPLREEFTVTSTTSTMADHGITDGLPIILFEANAGGSQDISFVFNNGAGDLTGSQGGSHIEGTTTVPSEIQLDFGEGIIPQTENILFGEHDNQGIANVTAEFINNHRELFAEVVEDNSNNPAVRIDDGLQRVRAIPTITVTTPGTSGLADNDFTVTQLQAGNPTTRIAEDDTIRYRTGDVSAIGNGWNFHQGVDGDRINLSTWPTTGEIFLHVGINNFIFADLNNTLGIDELTQNLQDITFTTLTFSYLFLELSPATTTYDVTGVRLLGTSTGSALVVVLDATTGGQSTENTDPLFDDEQFVGLTFRRTAMGNINESVPARDAVTNLNVTPTYSRSNFLNTDNVAFQNADGQPITLSSWPTTGNLLVRFSPDVFNIPDLRLLLRLNRLPDTTPQDVSDVTIRIGITTSFGNNIATYNVISARTVSDEDGSIILTLDGSTVTNQEGSGFFVEGIELPVNLTSSITHINSISISDFYNANNGSEQ